MDLQVDPRCRASGGLMLPSPGNSHGKPKRGPMKTENAEFVKACFARFHIDFGKCSVSEHSFNTTGDNLFSRTR